MAERPPFEIKALTANLPAHTITFVYPNEGIPYFPIGIFRAEFVRKATAADEQRFKDQPDDICPHCGRVEAD